MNRKITAEEMIAETNRQWAKLKSAIDSSQVRWVQVPKLLEGSIAFNGVCPIGTVNVMQATNPNHEKMCLGAMSPLDSLFSIIKLTPEMTEYCLNAAQAAQN